MTHKLKEPMEALTAHHKTDIRQALVEWCIEEGIDTTKRPRYDEVIEELLPFLVEINEYWEGLDSNNGWESSSGYAEMVKYLESQFRKEGKYLQ